MVEPLLKTDMELKNLYLSKKKMRGVRQLETLMNKSYQNIGATDLAAFVEDFTRRAYLLHKYFPPTLSDVLFAVLNHPQLESQQRIVHESIT